MNRLRCTPVINSTFYFEKDALEKARGNKYVHRLDENESTHAFAFAWEVNGGGESHKCNNHNDNKYNWFQTVLLFRFVLNFLCKVFGEEMLNLSLSTLKAMKKQRFGRL